jgi:AraC family transcriptional regulator
MTARLADVRRLVGDISPRQYRHVDVALAKHVGVFTPVSGPCEYATSPAHTHPSYSFVLSFDGATRMLLDGEIQCANPGELSGVAPGIPHQELPGDGPPRYAAILIAPRYLQRQLRMYPKAVLPPLRGNTWAAPADLCRTVKDFMIECESSLPGRSALVEAHSLRLCHALLRLILGVSHGTPVAATRMDINRAVEFAQSHLHEPVQVTDLARAAGLSVSHFSREFQREMGIGPKQYLVSARLGRARRLLLAGEGNITEVAHAAGFGSSAHFASAFRAAFGTSPSAFRHAGNKQRIS